MAKIRFTDNTPDYSPIPGGTYEATLTKFDSSSRTQKGNQQFIFTFTIDELGRNLSLFHNDNENALWALKRTMKKLGCSESDFPKGEEIDIDDLVDRKCMGARVRLRVVYNEKEDRNEIRGIYPINDGGEIEEI